MVSSPEKIEERSFRVSRLGNGTIHRDALPLFVGVLHAQSCLLREINTSIKFEEATNLSRNDTKERLRKFGKNGRR